jgi:hypothetical protein
LSPAAKKKASRQLDDARITGLRQLPEAWVKPEDGRRIAREQKQGVIESIEEVGTRLQRAPLVKFEGLED